MLFSQGYRQSDMIVEQLSSVANLQHFWLIFFFFISSSFSRIFDNNFYQFSLCSTVWCVWYGEDLIVVRLEKRRECCEQDGSQSVLGGSVLSSAQLSREQYWPPSPLSIWLCWADCLCLTTQPAANSNVGSLSLLLLFNITTTITTITLSIPCLGPRTVSQPYRDKLYNEYFPLFLFWTLELEPTLSTKFRDKIMRLFILSKLWGRR